jgi:hypothetical protein
VPAHAILRGERIEALPEIDVLDRLLTSGRFDYVSVRPAAILNQQLVGERSDPILG